MQGLTLGLAYVAPIGLQNIFVINSTLSASPRKALLTALIVIFFDITLAIACFFGIGAAMERFSWLRTVISLLGSILVIFIGIRLVISTPEHLKKVPEEIPTRKLISSACIVTWFNPQAIIDGTMMLGAFHATLPEHGIISFIIGVSCASCLWFTGLSLAISLSSGLFTDRIMRVISIICGIIITAYGAKLLYSSLGLAGHMFTA